MLPIVTDRVTWTVGRFVCHNRDPVKTAEPIEMPFGLWNRMDPRNNTLDGVQVPRGKGQF